MNLLSTTYLTLTVTTYSDNGLLTSSMLTSESSGTKNTKKLAVIIYFQKCNSKQKKGSWNNYNAVIQKDTVLLKPLHMHVQINF